MPNIADPRLATLIDRCWDLYLRGLLADLVATLPAPRRRLEATRREIDPRTAGNAEVELRMLETIVRMVISEGRDDALRCADALAAAVSDVNAPVDGTHRVGAFTVGVHAAMRHGRIDTAEERFRQALALSQGLVAEGGEDGVSLEDVSTLIGCAGLHLAVTAAVVGDASTTVSLLDHSTAAAEVAGREHAVMGQYFGPQHVVATRSIALATLRRPGDCIAAAHAVDLDKLFPVVQVSFLRTLADAHDQLEQRAAATAARTRADAISPPLRRQLGFDADPPRSSMSA